MNSCGCLGSVCVCDWPNTPAEGRYRMMCRCCRLVWAGDDRAEVMSLWHAHIRTPEHYETAKVEIPRIHAEDAERDRQRTLAEQGALF
jgi:hypothetical protein